MGEGVAGWRGVFTSWPVVVAFSSVILNQNNRNNRDCARKLGIKKDNFYRVYSKNHKNISLSKTKMRKERNRQIFIMACDFLYPEPRRPALLRRHATAASRRASRESSLRQTPGPPSTVEVTIESPPADLPTSNIEHRASFFLIHVFSLQVEKSYP